MSGREVIEKTKILPVLLKGMNKGDVRKQDLNRDAHMVPL